MSAEHMERRAAAGVTARGRTLEGYAARFGVPARIGGFTERIAPGAFTTTLASGRDVLALADHNPGAVLGRTKSGTLQLRQDGEGLHFTLALPDTQAGRDLAELAARGDLGGMSFGFVATDEAWDGDMRELRALELHEISVVQSWPAYPDTAVALRRRAAIEEEANFMAFLRDPIIVGRAWLETCR